MKEAQALGLMATVLVVGTLTAVQDRPNFSGRWVQVSPAQGAGSEQLITHDDATLLANHDSEGAGHRGVYKLDGNEHENLTASHGTNIVTKSRGEWSGAKLVITSVTDYPDGRTMTDKQVWALDPDGRLVIELLTTDGGQKPMEITIIYTKRP